MTEEVIQKSFIEELIVLNTNLRQQLRILKKEYEQKTSPKIDKNRLYPSQIQGSLLKNLKLKQELYSQEFEHAQSRVQKLSSNYSEKLERKIARKSRRLELLEEEHEKITKVNDIKIIDKDYSSDFQKESNLKRFYESKIQDLILTLEKNASLKKESYEKLESYKKQYTHLKSELLLLNQKNPIEKINSSKILTKLLNLNKRRSERSIHCLETKATQMQRDLRQHRKHEHSISNLLKCLSTSSTPMRLHSIKIRSSSQPKISFKPSLHNINSNQSFF